ncbi:hypothetical protein K438DRAFT_1996559 [Mycena galopus ATCC 62051]|nr:hypothetical protein K438DRAFT_1996559 [Mycena galopus ATCC 62051]
MSYVDEPDGPVSTFAVSCSPRAGNPRNAISLNSVHACPAAALYAIPAANNPVPIRAIVGSTPRSRDVISLVFPAPVPSRPEYISLGLTLRATSTFTGYGPRPWPLPAAASNFPPRATPYPEALVVRHLQCSTGRTNFPYRTYSSSTDTRAAKPNRNPGRLCCLPPPTEP